MTLFEKFKELYSCEVDFETFSKKECVNEYDLLAGHYDTETADSMCDISDANFDCCKKCWNQECIENHVPDINVGNKNEITLYKVMKALSDYCESQNCGKCPLWKRGPCLLTCYIPCNYNEDVLPCLSEESITLKIEE